MADSVGAAWADDLPPGTGTCVAVPGEDVGRLPVNAQLGAYYNIVRPDGAAEWQLRVQVQLLFLK